MRRLGLLLILAPIILSAAGCPRDGDAPVGKEPEWFEDVTSKRRLAFTHDDGGDALGYFMPRISGSGGAVLDYDGDGRLDLYLVNNGGPKGKKNGLFHQEDNGTFRDVSNGSGLDVSGFGQGVAVGDVNNDGLPDVLLTEFGATRLFLNEGKGKFREITRETGIDNPLWATAAAFFDFDRDGWLDFIVVNYLDYDQSRKCGSSRPDFCPPQAFKGTPPKLYRNAGLGNDGKIRFVDATLSAGLGAAAGKSLGVICADVDGDRWPDIIVANDMCANFVWINGRDGTFREEGLIRGLAHTGAGQVAGNMGIAWADCDDDGLPDIFITHINEETHTLWRQSPRGKFQDRTLSTGLTHGQRSTGFGTAFVDFDRDGWPDLAWVNGGAFRNSNAAAGGTFWSAYAQRNQLFANDGNGRFRDLTTRNPAFCGELNVGRGLIVADLDNDGAPDLITTAIAGPAKILRNVAPQNGHWLTIRALLPQQKRDAYGAEITVQIGNRTFWRLLNPAYSYCCSNDPRVHFGLGNAEHYDHIRVIWPDGVEELFPGGAADRMVELRQGQGKAP